MVLFLSNENISPQDSYSLALNSATQHYWYKKVAHSDSSIWQTQLCRAFTYPLPWMLKGMRTNKNTAIKYVE